MLAWLLQRVSLRLLRWVRPPPKKLHIVMQGLDAAGKTTILHILTHHQDDVIQDVMPQCHCPVNDYYTKRISTNIHCIGFITKTLLHEESQLDIISWDVGGPAKIRPLFRFFMRDAQAFCFVIDSNDPDRLDVAKDQFWRSISDFQQSLEKPNKSLPVLIVANKQDLPHAIRPMDMAKELELHRLRQPWRLQGISASSEGHVGLHPAFDWLRHGRTPRTEFQRNCHLVQLGRAEIKDNETDSVLGATCKHLPFHLCLVVAEYMDHGNVVDYEPPCL